MAKNREIGTEVRFADEKRSHASRKMSVYATIYADKKSLFL